MSADLIRRAADALRDPNRCNTNAHDAALANWLDEIAAGWVWDEDGEGGFWDDGMPLRLEEAVDSHALTVARMILGREAPS